MKIICDLVDTKNDVKDLILIKYDNIIDCKINFNVSFLYFLIILFFEHLFFLNISIKIVFCPLRTILKNLIQLNNNLKYN